MRPHFAICLHLPFSKNEEDGKLLRSASIVIILANAVFLDDQLEAFVID